MLEEDERAIISGIVRLADRPVREVMTPRTEVDWIDVDATPEEIRQALLDTPHSRIPVADGSVENIVGVIQTRDVLAARLEGRPLDLSELCRKAPVIPDLMDAMDALAVLRSADVPLALVHDEYGHLDGIVTPGSILAALAGTFAHDVEQGEEPPLVEREDGSWLVSGAASADLLSDRLGMQPAGRPRLFDRRRVCAVGAQASAGDRRDVPARRLVVRDRRHGRPQDRQADRLAAEEAGGRSRGRSGRLELSEPLLEAVDVVAGEIIGLLDDAVAGDAGRGTRRAARRAARSRSESDARAARTGGSRARAARRRTSGRRP